MDKTQVRVLATEGEGWLYVGNRKTNIKANEEITITY